MQLGNLRAFWKSEKNQSPPDAFGRISRPVGSSSKTDSWRSPIRFFVGCPCSSVSNRPHETSTPMSTSFDGLSSRYVIAKSNSAWTQRAISVRSSGDAPTALHRASAAPNPEYGASGWTWADLIAASIHAVSPSGTMLDHACLRNRKRESWGIPSLTCEYAQSSGDGAPSRRNRAIRFSSVSRVPMMNPPVRRPHARGRYTMRGATRPPPCVSFPIACPGTLRLFWKPCASIAKGDYDARPTLPA
jgi:hypothetical protein